MLDCPKWRGPPSGRSPPRPCRYGILRGAGVHLLLAGYWLISLAGCGVPDRGESAGIAPFPGSGSSLPEVGQWVVEGLAAGDHASLVALRLSRDEYVDVVWPELPASDPDLNVPIEYVWADIEARNRSALIRLAPQFEGLAADLEEVVCSGGVQEFETFRVHTDCWVVLRMPSGKHRIQLFKDVVERGAGYKLFRYYDDVLRPVETGPAGRTRTRVGEAARVRQLPVEEVIRCPTTTTPGYPSTRPEDGHLPGAPGHPDPAAGRAP